MQISLKKVIVLIIAAAIVYSTMEIALKHAGISLDPFQITFLRCIIGGLVLLPFALIECRERQKGFMTKRHWLYMLILGVLNVPITMVFFQMGVNHSNAATAAVIICANPLFTIVFANFLTDDDKITRYKILALAFGATGLVLMISPWNIHDGDSIPGALFMLSSAAAFGLYTAIGSKTVRHVGVILQTSVSFIMGSLVLLVIILLLGRPVLAGLSGDIGVILVLLYAGIIATGIGFLLYFNAIKYSNATTGSIVFLLKPVIAPVFAVLFLGETIALNMYFGIALMLTASFILLLKR